MTPTRQEMHDIVSAILPFDSLEKEHLAAVKQWIESGAALFRIQKPSIPNPHLVSYFALVDETESKILLVNHKKASLWLPSGGHVERDEHPKETVRREAQEELQIDADFLFDGPVFLTVTETQGRVERHTDISLW